MEPFNLFAVEPDTRTLDKKVAQPKEERPTKPESNAPELDTDAFSLDSVDEAWADQTEIMTQRQTAETEALTRKIELTTGAAQQAQTVKEDALYAAQGTRNQQLAVMSGVDRALEKANRAIALSNSNNPLDRLQLWALQQSDPAYTSEGSLKEIQYYQQASAALGERGVIQQGAYADQLTRIQQNLEMSLMGDQNELALLMQREQQGAERLQMAQEVEAARLGKLQTQNSMQQAALANLTADQVAAAEQQALNSESGIVNVGGVNLSLAQVQTRKADLADIAYHTTIRQTQYQELILGDLTLPEVEKLKLEASNNKSGNAIVKGQLIPLARIQERETQLLNQDANAAVQQATLHNINRSLINETDNRILARMAVPELTKLINSGGVDASGYQYDLSLVKQNRDMKIDTQNSEIMQQVSLANFGDPLKNLTDTRARMSSLKVGTNSPILRKFIEEKTRVLNTLTTFVAPADGSQPTPENVLVTQQAVDALNAQLTEAIKAEATALAGDDKQLAEAYTYSLQGQAIPEEVITSALRERKASNKPLDRWLNAKDLTLFNTVYEQTKRDIVGSQTLNPLGGKLDNSDVEAIAIDKALDAVRQQGSIQMNDSLFALQGALADDHPAKLAGITPTQMLEMIHRADQIGVENYLKANPNLTSEEAAAIRSGKSGDYQLGVMQSAALFAELEKEKPGLGRSYVNWWNSDSRDPMVTKFLQSQQAKTQSFQDQVQFSLLSGATMDAGSYNATILAEGQRFWYADENMRQHAEYVTFQGNPVNKQVFLLDRDKGLTDTERQQIMQKIINPLLSDAQAKQLNAADTSNYVESMLKTMEPEDSATRKLLNKLLIGREGSLEVLDSFIEVGNRTKGVGLGRDAMNVGESLMGMFGWKPDSVATATNNLKWYNDIRP